MVRATLLARGLNDDELQRGWKLYAELHGFGSPAPARPATKETAAAQAINELDAWDAPNFNAVRAVLFNRFPDVERFLFNGLEATTGVEAVTGVERFLDRIAALRDGKADLNPDNARAAIELLATRQLIDPKKESDLRALIETARLGARPDEAIPAPTMDPARRKVAEEFIDWLHEWREVSRLSVNRRDYRISLGIAQRRRTEDGTVDDVPDDLPPPAPAQPVKS